MLCQCDSATRYFCGRLPQNILVFKFSRGIPGQADEPVRHRHKVSWISEAVPDYQQPGCSNAIAAPINPSATSHLPDMRDCVNSPAPRLVGSSRAENL